MSVTSDRPTGKSSSTTLPATHFEKLNDLFRDAAENLPNNLARFVSEVVSSAGGNLVCLSVFGGVARGRYRAGRSDINIILVLERTDATDLAAIAPAVRSGWRSLRVHPMILSRSELSGAARSFPVKLLDIQSNHIVLAGVDVFVGLNISTARVLWQIEQELRNSAIRLRLRAVREAGDADAIAFTLSDCARSIAISLLSLLKATGRKVPSEDRTAAIFDAAAREFGLDSDAFAQLAALRANPVPREGLNLVVQKIVQDLIRAANIAGEVNSERRED